MGDTARAAFAEAQRWLREHDVERSVARDRARLELERAVAAAPAWIPPRRALDDLATEELVGVDALKAHLEALDTHGDDPRAMYLAGRLEGPGGTARFERAVKLDAKFAWGHHGLAWTASRESRPREAVEHARKAVACAESAWERSFFTASLARFLDAAGQGKVAVRELERRLEDDDLSPRERDSLRYELVRIELKRVGSSRALRAHTTALELVRTAELGETELRTLCTELRMLGSFYDPRSVQLELALASKPSSVRDRIRGEILIANAPTPLALGMFEESYRRRGLALPAGRTARMARFAAGAFTRAIEIWLASLPRAVLDAREMPADARLARIVECGRALAGRGTSAAGDAVTGGDAGTSATPTADRLHALGEALIDAGWFQEARSVAASLAADDLERALALHTRAVAGVALVEDWTRLAGGSDAVLARALPETVRTDVSKDIDGLLSALAVTAARAHVWLGGETDPVELDEAFARSPRIDYGPIGAIVHPGPAFSAFDERAGVGERGAAVPGLAAELDRIGRFGLVGQAIGDREPDATILPKLWSDVVEGEHLGVRWKGTAVWCETPDLNARAARRGAEIAAAALHEGYWIDVDTLRREHDSWVALLREFSGEDGESRVERALAVTGLRVGAPATGDDAETHARARVTSLLREADRVRLAVMRDRGRAAGAGAARLECVDLDEIIEATAIHEQGHLCDRTRFFPVLEHWGEILFFLLDSGFSPRRVGERLEGRAQLVSLCASPDPRLPLAQVLDSAEDSREGVTPHSRAYAELAREFVAMLSKEIARAPADYEELDPERTLTHQLHRLPPEKVRRVALLIAREKRMVE